MEAEQSYIELSIAGINLRWNQMALNIIGFIASLCNIAFYNLSSKIIKLKVKTLNNEKLGGLYLAYKLIASRIYCEVYCELLNKEREIKRYINSKVYTIITKLYNIRSDLDIAYHQERIRNNAFEEILIKTPKIVENILNQSISNLFQRIRNNIDNEITYLKINKDTVKEHINSEESIKDHYDNWFEFWKQQEPGREERHTLAQRQIQQGIKIRDRWLENVQSNALEFTRLHINRSLYVLDNIDIYVPDSIIKDSFMLQVNNAIEEWGKFISKLEHIELEATLKEIIIKEIANEMKNVRRNENNFLKKKKK